MTIDEAKAALQILRGHKAQADFMDEALDIALWLMEREDKVILLRAEIDAEFCFELRVLDEWERNTPRPGS